jgi:hypothetical protein
MLNAPHIPLRCVACGSTDGTEVARQAMQQGRNGSKENRSTTTGLCYYGYEPGLQHLAPTGGQKS